MAEYVKPANVDRGLKCHICRVPTVLKLVDQKIAIGLSHSLIARQMTEAGTPMSHKTVERHHQNHFEMTAAKSGARGAKDLAIVVRDKVLEAVENGDLQPTDNNWKNVTPGLQAQNLLDKREARVDDRKAQYVLATLLYGAPGVLVMPPERLMIADGNDIEGEFVEVT